MNDQIAIILFPPSTVTRALILTLQYSIPNFFTRRETTTSPFLLPSSVSLMTCNIADGANSRASPTFNSTISLIMDPARATPPESSAAAGNRCALIVRNQSGDVKRWTSVKEHRSRSFGEMVGSCVAIIILHPLCRWRRITDNKESVSFEAPMDSTMNCVGKEVSFKIRCICK